MDLKFESEYTFPFELHDYQKDAVAVAVETENHCCLMRHKVGLGKTPTSLAAALENSIVHGTEQIVILCPPILSDQWYDFIQEIPELKGQAVIYRGSPTERDKINLQDFPIIICSYNIFIGSGKRPVQKEGEEESRFKSRVKMWAIKKKDWTKFVSLGESATLTVIADELSCKSLKSQTYRKLKQLLYRRLRLKLFDAPYHRLIALNATPLSSLGQVYNWTSLMAPGVYDSKRSFDLAHVRREDNWGNVIEWANEDLLRENMELFSIDAPPGSVKLPPIVYTKTPYKLTGKHAKLYRDVANAELEALPEDKIQLALASMFSTLQRLILVPEEFGLKARPAFLDYLDQYLDQIGNDQVVIFTRHRAVSKKLHDYIDGSAAIYGDITEAARKAAFSDFKEGSVRILVANMDSVGHGLNLQFCHRVMFAELPFRGDRFEQTVGRVYRQGQRETCFADIALAKGTLQGRIYDNLLKNDDDICEVLRTRESVRNFLNQE